MALRIENKQDAVKLFDWEEETKLSHTILKLADREDRVKHGPKVVVLTDATGLLGQALLNTLIKDPEIEKVYCIGVRHAEQRQSLFTLQKAAIYEGDLMLPRLGLATEDAEKIFGEADRIIHSGADVSHLKTFHSLRRANLQSIKELIEMSLPRQIPFHYLSTAGIAIYSGRAVFEEVSASPNPPPLDGIDGYLVSKWTSERYLEKVNEHCG